MPDEPELIYLEPDDEITSVARRLRSADAQQVVLVAPGRSKATSSAVALRLLEGVANTEGRQVAVVGDALTRSLAVEAGLSAYGSVADAAAANPATSIAPQRAAIHVVRGDEPTVAVATQTAPPTPPRPRPTAQPIRDDDTQVVPVLRPVSEGRRAMKAERAPTQRRTRLPVAAMVAVLAVLLAAGVAAAAVLPAATIVVIPATTGIGPVGYELRFDDPQLVAGTVEATHEGTATGTYSEPVAAAGTAVFLNWNVVAVEVPAGIGVAAGEVIFATQAAIIVPPGQLTPDGRIQAGEGAVAIVATQAGAAGNVAAHAIDTVLDEETDRRLRGFPNNPERTVDNAEATAGGLDVTGPEITQPDVDAAAAALTATLQAQLAETLANGDGLVTADPAEPSQPTISGADGLVGTRDQPTFELSGELAYDRAVVRLSDVEAAARDRLVDDGSAIPAGQELIPESIRVTVESARRDGAALVAAVSVSAQSAGAVDATSVTERVAGLPIAQAESDLAELGTVEIVTWPDWVDEVPTLTWRIDVRIEAPSVSQPSAAPSASPVP